MPQGKVDKMDTDWMAEKNDAGQTVYTAIYGDMESGLDLQCWEWAGEWRWNVYQFDGVLVAEGTARTLRDAKRLAVEAVVKKAENVTGGGKTAALRRMHGMGFVPAQRGKG